MARLAHSRAVSLSSCLYAASCLGTSAAASAEASTSAGTSLLYGLLCPSLASGFVPKPPPKPRPRVRARPRATPSSSGSTSTLSSAYNRRPRLPFLHPSSTLSHQRYYSTLSDEADPDSPPEKPAAAEPRAAPASADTGAASAKHASGWRYIERAMREIAKASPHPSLSRPDGSAAAEGQRASPRTVLHTANVEPLALRFFISAHSRRVLKRGRRRPRHGGWRASHEDLGGLLERLESSGFELAPGEYARLAEVAHLCAKLGARRTSSWEEAHEIRKEGADRMEKLLAAADRVIARNHLFANAGEQADPLAPAAEPGRIKLVPLWLRCLHVQVPALRGHSRQACERMDVLLQQNEIALRALGPRPQDWQGRQLSVRRLAEAMGSVFDSFLFHGYAQQRGPSTPEDAMMAERKRKNQIAMLALQWFCEHEQALPFLAGNTFPTAIRGFNSLVGWLSDPRLFATNVWNAASSDWRLRSGPNVIMLFVLGLLRRTAPREAYRLYELAAARNTGRPAHSNQTRLRRNITFPELLRRRLLRRLSYMGEHQFADDMIGDLVSRVRKDENGFPLLEQATLRTILMHRARAGDLKGVEFHLDAIRTLYPDAPPLSIASLTVNALMLCYAQKGDVANVVVVGGRIYDMEQQPGQPVAEGKRPLTAYAFRRLIQAQLSRGDAVGAEETLERMEALGLKADLPIYNLMLQMYARRGDASSGLSLLEAMRSDDVQPNSVTYNHMVQLFALRGDSTSAARAVIAMHGENVAPERYTYTSLLNAYVEAGEVGQALELFQWLTRQGPLLAPSIETANVILKLHVLRSAPVQDVLKFYESCKSLGMKANSRTYTLVMQSAVDAGVDRATGIDFIELAEDTFHEADRRLPNGADVYHFTVLINGFLRRGEPDRARNCFEEMRKRGIEPTSITWSIVIGAYARAPDEDGKAQPWELARALSMRLLDEAELPAAERALAGAWSRPALRQREPIEPLFHPLINASSNSGLADQTADLLRQLEETGTSSSVPTLTTLLHAYRSEGEARAALQIWQHIFDNALGALKLNAELVASQPQGRIMTYRERMRIKRLSSKARSGLCLPLSIILDALSSASMHTAVERVWLRVRDEGFSFDAHNWNHLAIALVRAGRLEDGLRIVDAVLTDPRPHVQYYQRKTMRDSASLGSEEVPEDWRPAPLKSPAKPPADMKIQLDGQDIVLAGARDAGVEPPSRPPNRRHRFREGDDPLTPPPFSDAEEKDEASEEEDDEALAPHALDQYVQDDASAWPSWLKDAREIQALEDSNSDDGSASERDEDEEGTDASAVKFSASEGAWRRSGIPLPPRLLLDQYVRTNPEDQDTGGFAISQRLWKQANPDPEDDYWFTHFATLQTLTDALEALRSGRLIESAADKALEAEADKEATSAPRDARARWAELMRTYPRARGMLEQHQRFLALLEQRQALSDARVHAGAAQ